jgi:hypothetical protein
LLIAGMTLAAAPATAAQNGVRSPADLFAGSTAEFSAQTIRRPRITVYPRRTTPGPNAKRVCQTQLVTEYRASGTVIVPHTRCRWQ